ncbi:hypothetical protein BpHYR1_041855 [Brachionus plicatilis]|uniref:Uncharacterized protein n=1 Tax=Brachionus plicatilis TaxID=10195 RepID=A0A3M7Q370_BRAPC|nr:hypothetical protein BpHYR1_041855 [Brachionus plicatilis]
MINSFSFVEFLHGLNLGSDHKTYNLSPNENRAKLSFVYSIYERLPSWHPTSPQPIPLNHPQLTKFIPSKNISLSVQFEQEKKI